MADRRWRRAMREMHALRRACRSSRPGPHPAGTPSSAASSPMPSATSARCAPQARKKRSIRPISVSATRGAPSVLGGRSSRAARSSTALTNLWPSVAPKRLARFTASLMATRKGTSGREPSSYSPDQQHRVLDRVELLRLPVHPARQLRVQVRARMPHPLDQGAEVLAVGLAACPRRRRTPAPGPATGTSLSCHRYSACSASLRATLRAPL